MSREPVKLPQISLAQQGGSALDRYARRVVGRPGLGALLRYELLTALLGPIPGAAGLLLRSLCYPLLVPGLGRGVFIGRSVTLRHPGKIRIGAGTLVDEYATLDAKSEQDPGIVFAERCQIGRNSIVSTGYFGRVRIGAGTIIGNLCLVHGPGGIEIGSGCLVGDLTALNAGTHVVADPALPILDQGLEAAGIRIEDDVWIGTSAAVADGVTIGRGAVVRAGGVVTQDVEPLAIVAGNPARVVGRRGGDQAA